MKYIRTKNGIYDEEKANLIADAESGEIFVGQMIDSFTSHLERVIKQADTVEELCDVYVSVYEEQLDNEIFWANKYTPMEVKDFYTGYIPKEVYGAIWTDKGLIYVAKMNQKGDLELL